jgi:hypothetical protein
MCKQSQKTHLLWFEKILFNEPVGTNRESTTRSVLLFQLGASGCLNPTALVCSKPSNARAATRLPQTGYIACCKQAKTCVRGGLLQAGN